MDFLFDSEPPKEEPIYVGPNIKDTVTMTPRKFAQSVLEVFTKLGGTSWLMVQAQADPRAFLELLKKLIPKSVQLDDLTGLQVSLIDQFGNEIHINKHDSGAPPDAAISSKPTKSGQLPLLEIATGGSPSSDQGIPDDQEMLPSEPVTSAGSKESSISNKPSPEINIKNIFE